MVLVVIALVVLGIAVIYGFVKAINAIFNPAIKKLEARKARILQTDNPYIQSHRIKRHNDKMYQEYLEWLDKTGADMPFEKWKTEEEKQFDKFQDKITFNKWRPNR